MRWYSRVIEPSPGPPATGPDRYKEAELANEPDAIPLRPIYPVRLYGSDFGVALSRHTVVKEQFVHGQDVLAAQAALGFFLGCYAPNRPEVMEQDSFRRIQRVAVDLTIRLLDQNRQRATYGAVGPFVGLPARSVTTGGPKDRLNSWVVSKATGLPLGYAGADLHPAIEERDSIIEKTGELREWLRDAW